MASPCEVLMDTQDPIVGESYFQKIKSEAERLEAKFSRYQKDNIVYAINSADGKKINIDVETAALLEFSKQCYDMSGGLFDITSGVLRRVWDFKNFKTFPAKKDVNLCLQKVGFLKIQWSRRTLQMPPGMEIDFGGIVKEYAVDAALSFIPLDGPATLVNFGGDLAVNKAPRQGSWRVAIEEAFKNRIQGSQLALSKGALATSGNTYRFFDYEGQRYSHILNPKTGYPVANGIASITVFAENCTMAGLLATVSHLQPHPEEFLRQQDVPHWLVKHATN